MGARRVVPGASSFASPIAARHPTSRARSSAAGEVTEAADDDTPGARWTRAPTASSTRRPSPRPSAWSSSSPSPPWAPRIAGTPLFLELASPDLPANAKLTVSLVVDTFGAFTTGLLQWFVSPYVLKMRMADEHTVAVEKLTLFARRYEETFAVADMREAETTRPLVTWEAGGKLHYVEMGRVPVPVRQVGPRTVRRPGHGGEAREGAEGGGRGGRVLSLYPYRAVVDVSNHRPPPKLRPTRRRLQVATQLLERPRRIVRLRDGSDAARLFRFDPRRTSE